MNIFFGASWIVSLFASLLRLISFTWAALNISLIQRKQNYSMNPEHYAQQTALNHSILWRKPYSFEKSVPQQSINRKQMNELAKTGVSWRTRNNMIRTNSSGFRLNRSQIKNSHSSFRVSRALDKERNESPETQHLKESIMQNSDVLAKSAKLIKGMEDLRQMGLLSHKQMQRVKYPGVIKAEHIHNDYHAKVTNPGYSRNHLGKHYTK